MVPRLAGYFRRRRRVGRLTTGTNTNGAGDAICRAHGHRSIMSPPHMTHDEDREGMRLFPLASCVPLLAASPAARSCPALRETGCPNFRVRNRLQISPRSMARTALDATGTTDRMEPHSTSRTPTIRPGWTMLRCGRLSPMANRARRCRPSAQSPAACSPIAGRRLGRGMRSAWGKSGALDGAHLRLYTATLKAAAAESRYTNGLHTLSQQMTAQA